MTIPEGLNFGIVVSFPGYSETGEYGIAGSVDAVLGGDAGVERRIDDQNSPGKINFRSLLKSISLPSYTGEVDYNWEKRTARDAITGLGDDEYGIMAGKFGGQFSVSGDGHVSGIGVKVGRGFNVGVNKNLPLFGGGWVKDEGWFEATD